MQTGKKKKNYDERECFKMYITRFNTKMSPTRLAS